MLRSMYSGISGLRSHQTMMDVTGNNIANVNTSGYKASSTVFEDTLSQVVRAAAAPQGDAGGTNPAQVGLGVRLGAITTNFSQGAAQTTGRSTDLMIQGDGFFAVQNGGEALFTRAGAFSFDASGTLVTSSGAKVLGWSAEGGAINPNGVPGPVQLPTGTLLAPTVTTSGSFGGNLPSTAEVGMIINSGVTMYDAQGNEHKMTYRFTKTGPDAWNAEVLEGGATLATVAVTFDANGRQTAGNPIRFTPAWGGQVEVTTDTLTQYGKTNSVASLGQNGSTVGQLQAFTIGPDGTMIGVFSNGLKQPLAQLAVANFNNPPGLEKVGGSMYRSTVNSGDAQVGPAGNGGRGVMSSGTLEMSNVDLAQEFTNLIVAQRGFQANSRIITASDEILQDLVNLKR